MNSNRMSEELLNFTRKDTVAFGDAFTFLTPGIERLETSCIGSGHPVSLGQIKNGLEKLTLLKGRVRSRISDDWKGTRARILCK
jgi:hypothetical protein